MPDVISGVDFSSLVGRFDYPMFIVTATDGDTRAGCLVGFAAQCSISPPLFMVWVSEKNHTFTVVGHTDTVAVHALAAEEKDLAALFGSRTGFTEDKFAQCGWQPGPGGVPLLDGCPHWFVGKVLDRVPTGDHTGLLLAPVAMSPDPGLGTQLGFQDVKDLDPGNEA